MIHSRRLRAVTTLATLGWMLTTAGPIAAKTITYTPQQVYYTYCFSHPPAARIASGDTVVTKTRDASNDLIQPTDKKPPASFSHLPAAFTFSLLFRGLLNGHRSVVDEERRLQ